MTADIIYAILIGLLMLTLLGMSVWIGTVLFVCGAAFIHVFADLTPGPVISLATWGSSGNWALVALPLFIWMGEILARTSLSFNLFQGLAPLVSRLPGRLLHINILGCGIMAAVAGSSSVTCATIGRISYPQLTKRGYDSSLIIGTLGAAGTLGLLIPPSIVLIVYGFVANVSVARLFLAGIGPGLLLMVLLSGYVAILSLINPKLTGQHIEEIEEDRNEERSRILGFRMSTIRLLPVVSLIVIVMGSIYGGFATPTEAAAVGVAGALCLATIGRDLTWQKFVDSAYHAVRTSAMIGFILAGANALTVGLSYSGIPMDIAKAVADTGVTVVGLLALFTLFYLVLGCFLDGFSMIVLTVSVVMPLVREIGIDPIWFGVYLVIVIELAQITPPVGFNLYVLQDLSQQDFMTVVRATAPFFIILLLAIPVLYAFPEIALYLPNAVYNN